MKKRLRQILIIGLLLIFVLVLALWFSIDGIIRQQVDVRATAALGVKTTLDQVTLNVFGGSLTLKGMNIANPAGFTDPSLVNMQSCSVTVNLHSLLTPTVKINTIAVNGLTMSLDINGLNTNLSTVLNNIKTNTASPAGSTAAAPATQTATQKTASGGKALAVEKVVLTNIKVIIRAGLLPGQSGVPITVVIPRLVLNQPTNPNGRPLRIADLFGQVLSAVALEAAKSPSIPSPVRDSLQTAGNILAGGGRGLLNSAGKLGQSLGKGVNQTVNTFKNLLTGQNKNNNGAAK